MARVGQLIRAERVKRGVTLREFCRRSGFDPSYWSRIERGIAAPPKTDLAFSKIAEALGISVASEQYVNLKDMAFLESSPSELAPDNRVLEYLPIFFKTARGQTPTEEEMTKLYEIIRRELDGVEK